MPPATILAMMPKRMGLVKCLISEKAQRQAARAGMLATPPHREGRDEWGTPPDGTYLG